MEQYAIVLMPAACMMPDAVACCDRFQRAPRQLLLIRDIGF
jgi:hypothetical protein